MRRFCLWLLMLFVFSVPWQNAVALGGTKTLTSYLGIGAVAITVLVCVIDRRVVRPHMAFVAFLVFVTWQLATHFWTIEPSATQQAVITLAQLLGVIWLVRELCTGERERLAVIQAFLFGCWVVCVVVIASYSSGQAVADVRYAPPDFNPNETADTLAIGIAMALLICARVKSRLVLWLNIAYVPLAIFAVVLTASRSGFVATCVACLGIFLLLRRSRPLLGLLLLVLIVGAGVGLFMGTSAEQDLGANLERVLWTGETGTIGTFSGRTAIWTAGIQVFSDHPAIGIGSGAFPLAVKDHLSGAYAAHNLFVQVAAESGLVGLFLLIAALAACIIPALRAADMTSFHVILLAVTLVMAFVANVQVSKVFWLVMALLAVSGRSSPAFAPSRSQRVSTASESGWPQAPSRA